MGGLLRDGNDTLASIFVRDLLNQAEAQVENRPGGICGCAINFVSHNDSQKEMNLTEAPMAKWSVLPVFAFGVDNRHNGKWQSRFDILPWRHMPMDKKRKAVLDRIQRLEEAITKAHEYLESGKHADSRDFRPLFNVKVRDGKILPPHKDWVKNVFLRRMEGAL